MINNFGIPEDVFSEILMVLRGQPKIECAKIFGSRAKGNYKRYSDIDIAIFANTDGDLSQNVKDALEDLDTIYNFDVLHYDKISNVEIKAHINRVGIEILCNSTS